MEQSGRAGTPIMTMTIGARPYLLRSQHGWSKSLLWRFDHLNETARTARFLRSDVSSVITATKIQMDRFLVPKLGHARGGHDSGGISNPSCRLSHIIEMSHEVL